MIPKLALEFPQAQTIDEVIEQLSDIITRSRQEQSRLGFFAALYRIVTIKVKEGINTGRFDDGARMEQFDVTFANRYLNALQRFRLNEPPSRCWLVAFEAAASWRPLILQHLLLGINAHINFDLGIAAAQIAPGAQLPLLKHDFDEINAILASLVNQVQGEIDELSPWLALLDRIGGKTDEAIINFSLDKARAQAWRVAQRLAALNPDQWGPELNQLDREASVIGHLVRDPGFWLSTGLLVIRLRESNDIPKIIDVLSQTSTAGV